MAVREPDTRPVVRVSRTQVLAARGRMIADSKRGRPTPEWIVKIANATPADGRKITRR